MISVMRSVCSGQRGYGPQARGHGLDSAWGEPPATTFSESQLVRLAEAILANQRESVAIPGAGRW